MKKAIIPSLITLAGLAAGAAAGFFLRPSHDVTEAENGAQIEAAEHTAASAEASHDGVEETREYLKLPNQFVVPVILDGQVKSLVVLSLSLELAAGNDDLVFAREPKLRDEMLQLFFDHANSGGFSGSFTDASSLAVLRRGLLTVAQRVLGSIVTDVLITDIMRQDS